MKKDYRKQDNKIIISGLILAAAIIVACVIGYRYLNTYLSGLSKKSKVTDVELSEEMRDELAHTTTVASDSHTPTPLPEEEGQTADTSVQITVLPETQHEMTLTPTMDPKDYWAIHSTPTPAASNEGITSHMASSFEAESSGYTVLGVSSATATSVLFQEGIDNSAAMAFDGDSTTSWQEGVEGNGEGQKLTAAFGGTVKIAYITFRVGNWRDYDMWRSNARPATMTAWVGGSGFEVNFEDTMTEFCLAFSRPISLSEITFEINTVFPGLLGDVADTCISEIKFYGGR